jgi:iron complex transport system permease protein
MTLLVLGMMFSSFTSAVVSLLLYFSVPERIQSYIQWTFGTFSGTTLDQLTVFVPLLLIGLTGSMLLAKPLNALLLGETYARSLGVNLQRTRAAIVLATALLAGTVTAFCGPIAFIGMAVPHVARALLHTSDHRMLLPACALTGAIAALLAAILAELPGSEIVLPLNAVTALIGAPIIIWIIISRSQRGAGY